MPAKSQQRKGASSTDGLGRNQPCPCGSGKKHKHCCGKTGAGHRHAHPALAWIAGIGLAVLLGLVLSWSGGPGGSVSSPLKTSNTGYTERDLPEVDFSSLTDSSRIELLGEINRLLCTCGCGLTLAQCVVTDSTCPVRNGNIQKIKDMVEKRTDRVTPREEPLG